MSIITVHTFVNNPPKESKLDKLIRLYRQTLEDGNYCKSVQAMHLINRLKEAEIQRVTSEYELHLAKQIIKNNYLNLIK
jgi:UDP-N-acetylglucosamine 2-epimerase